MQIISTSKGRNLRPVSSSSGRIISKYRRIKELFSMDKNHLTFCEPDEISADEIVWQTFLDGEKKRYIELDEEGQRYVRAKLKSQVNRLYKIVQDNTAKKYLDLFLQIPSLEDIYLVDDRVILSNWGFLDDKFNAKRNIIKKLLRGVILSLKIIDDKSEVIQDLKVEIFSNNESEIFMTNSEGYIQLVDVVKNSLVKIEIDLSDNSKFEDDKIQKEIEIMELDTEITITLKKKKIKNIFKKNAKVTFTIYDKESGKVVENAQIILNSTFDNDKQITDERGKASLKLDFKKNAEMIITANGYYKQKSEIEIYNLQRKEIYLKPIEKLEGKEGKIGDPRINISWENTTQNPQDIDLHLITPCKDEINYQNKIVVCGGFKGELDIDKREDTIGNCQENIVWENGAVRGRYKIRVLKFVGDDKSTQITLTILNNGKVSEEKFVLKKVKDSYTKIFEH